LKRILNKEEQEQYIYSKIGGPVAFKYSKGEKSDKSGKLVDRVVCYDGENSKAFYWNLLDLIRFKGEDEDWLRITYYRYKKEGRWVFAGQTSISDPFGSFSTLFIKAISARANTVMKFYCLSVLVEYVFLGKS
jgi:hypothetical protein